MRLLYFAYGSNLKWERMRERIPGARRAGLAVLAGYHVVCNKRGRDGSGKANLEAHPDREVWGALYELHPQALSRLDAFEPDYERVRVTVRSPGKGVLEALTYCSWHLVAPPVPHSWYRNLILEGAQEHALPAAYLARLRSLPALADEGAEVRDPRSAGPGRSVADARGPATRGDRP